MAGSNKMIFVRPARTNDQPGIQDVGASATDTLRRTYRPNQKALANKARISSRLRRLVAVVDGRVVGTVQYYPEDRSVRVVGLGVHEDFRRHGVGRSLFSFLQRIATREGATELRLYTVKETGNVEVFERLGFTVTAEREDELCESDRFERLTGVEMMMELPRHEAVPAARSFTPR